MLRASLLIHLVHSGGREGYSRWYVTTPCPLERFYSVRLKIDRPAPIFACDDAYGRSVNLTQYAGYNVLLSFYRAAVCPLCNLRFLHIADRYAEYSRQGLAVIAFFESSPETVRYYLDRHQPPFPVIADPSRTFYKLYGLESSPLGAMWGALRRGAQYREAKGRHAGGNSRFLDVFQMDGNPFRMPAEFMLRPDLSVGMTYYGRDAGDFMRLAVIDQYLANARVSAR